PCKEASTQRRISRAVRSGLWSARSNRAPFSASTLLQGYLPKLTVKADEADWQPWALCHEHRSVHTAMRNCTGDEGRSFEFDNQVLISSHRKLLWSKARVVNVAEKSGHEPDRRGRERRA